MDSPTKPPTWTWPTTIFVTLMAADLCALTWYLWALPVEESQRWEKTVGIVSGWVGSAMAFWGIKHGVGKKLSLASATSLPPVQLSMVVFTAGVWFFILPFHSISIDVLGPDAVSLPGVTATVDGESAPRPDASDSRGRLRVPGLLASTHRIVLKKPGYNTKELSASFAEVLTMGKLHPPPLEHADEMVVISSDPPGASIFVDSESESRGPTGNPVLLRAGTHRITLKSSGYESSSFEVAIRPGSPTPPPKLTLRALPPAKVRTYPLLISSVPPGAAIWEGKRFLGTTLATIRLPAGQHTIEFRREGYQIARGVVSVPEQSVFAPEEPLRKIAD